MRTNPAKNQKKKQMSIEQKFLGIAEAYQTMDPEQIKQRILWEYLSGLAAVLLTPGNRPHLHYHNDHFETCNKYIEHQRSKTIVNGTKG
jgi:2-iminoacetate synthase ThiH